jgi:methyl-accepting chemotaxis protein
MSTQAQTPPPPPRRSSVYAPANTNPLRLASATVQAVDQLGVATAAEIERTADDIMRGATEIAAKLRELANAIRQHTEIASEQVAGFCNRATSVFEGVVELQQKLAANGQALAARASNGNGHANNGHAAPARAEEDEPLELPEFMKKGPADVGDNRL